MPYNNFFLVVALKPIMNTGIGIPMYCSYGRRQWEFGGCNPPLQNNGEAFISKTTPAI